MEFWYSVTLGAVLSLDALATGISYGFKGISIKFASLLVDGIITFIATAVSLFGAAFLTQYVSSYAASLLGAFLLMGIGIWSMFTEYLSAEISDRHDNNRKIKVSIGRLVISIMANPEKADIDFSKSICLVEAFFLGLALGMDNMAAVFAAGLLGNLPVYTPVIMGGVQVLFICLGYKVATALASERFRSKFPYLPGAVLLLLGISRIVN